MKKLNKGFEFKCGKQDSFLEIDEAEEISSEIPNITEEYIEQQKTIQNLKVEYRDVSILRIYQFNSKIHTDEHIKEIANSIKTFGFNDPIGINKDNMILTGAGRYYAAKLLNLKEVPVIVLEHLDNINQKAYMPVHNKLSLNTGLDQEILRAEIKELENLNFHMVGLGFKEDEISLLLDINVEDLFENPTNDNTKNKNSRDNVIKDFKNKNKCPKCSYEY